MSEQLKVFLLGTIALLAASVGFLLVQIPSIPHIRAVGLTGVRRDKGGGLHVSKHRSAVDYGVLLQTELATGVTHGAGIRQSVQSNNWLPHHDVVTLPFSHFTMSAEELLRQDWIKQLQAFLRNCSMDSPVVVVAANYLYKDVVINWLVAAKLKLEPPLKNVLVVSFDLSLQELMQRVEIHSIGVFHDSMFLQGWYSYRKLLVARVTVLRMINYFGYDVAHYDTDAIVLRNPLPLYDKYPDSDVVGSTGSYPPKVKYQWGFTLCMGAILFRSTPRTELFWDTWSKTDRGTDDQVVLNYAMVAMNMTWDRHSVIKLTSHGKGGGGFKVTALSQSRICRMTKCHAKNADHYYVWHKGGPKNRDSKIKTSSEIGSWHLKTNWLNITMEGTAKGVEWLRRIAV